MAQGSMATKRAAAQHTLMDLDDACLMRIFKHLMPLPDLFQVAQTCWRFHRLTSDKRMWLVVAPSSISPEVTPSGRAGLVYPSLKAAVAASRPGDTIWLAPGMQHEATNVTIPWPLHILGGGLVPEDTQIFTANSADFALSFSAKAAQAAVATVQAELPAHSTGELALMDPAAIWWPLLLSTLAGLSTTIGGLIAVSFAPSEGTLAFLLGTAIGVMATVSGVELWWHSAAEQHDILGITAAVAAGAVLFAVLDPLLPKHEEGHMDSKQEIAAVAGAQERHVAVRIDPFSSSNNGSNSSSAMQQTPAACSSSSSSCEAQLIDTTLLQAALTITLTIHNLPEGFAVAFSAFTNIGPIMALAIALHNIPEGLVIAAPLYAATGSKLTALGATAASGLSEPVGALLALLVFKPFVTSLAQLDYVLAATGGVMLAVCVLELWPEGRRCGQDGRLWQGIALGTVVMGWTLYVGV
ncbi:hypothetical protein OEZ85_013182 [Tetradesmus obliquus]|uniref:F-box domain-containing protein n=1 Tax=Tetradesmus obliquus TaxID=3088 RepID=A0ABY8U5X5_TETOB|nr:hypothetical protein OEZ85_013182 [Tetradesmus obliquus]